MPDGDNVISWVLSGAVAAVVALWRLGEGKNAAAIVELKTDRDYLKKQSDECRKDREEFRVKLATNEAETKALKHELSLYIKKHADDLHG